MWSWAVAAACVVRLQDGTGGLSLRFYHFSNAQKEGLKRGTAFAATAKRGPGASGLEIYHPEYRALTGDEPPPVDETLTPVYPLTEGLTQQRLRQLCMQTLTHARPQQPARLAAQRTGTRLSIGAAGRCDPLFASSRQPMPMSTNSPSAITGPSTAWPSKNC
jgi:RecG-like helicase